MLFVDVRENLRVAKGGLKDTLYSAAMSGIASRLEEASIYVLDPNATAMCANVFFSRPSSILTALGYARLPGKSVWIEYSTLALREAFQRLGNENHWVEGSVFIERAGLLLTQKESVIEMEALAQFRTDSGKLIELLTATCRFDTTPGFEVLPSERSAPQKIESGATGQVKRYYDLISRDEKERAARDEIKARFAGHLHRDWVRLASMTPDLSNKIEQTLHGHVGDMYNMFTQQILPSLILMNCRNAIEQDYVDAPEKLNKARRKKGRPEIGPYRIVKLKLRPNKRRIHEGRESSGTHMTGGLVSGHFKVRRTGVFWWSPHVKFGGPPPGSPKTLHVVTR